MYLTLQKISRTIQNRLVEEGEYISSDLVYIITEMFLEEVLLSLKKKIPVKIPNFGVFSVKLTKPRQIKDPITNTHFQLPWRYRGKFKFAEQPRKQLADIPTEDPVTINFED